MFLKLKDKETLTGTFQGDIYEFYSKWVNGKSVVTDENDQESSFRFRINFVYKENGTLCSKIFEGGATVYNMLKDLHSEYDLPKIFVKMTRNGVGTSTTYSLLPMLKVPVNAAQIKDIELQALEHPTNGSKRDDVPMPDADDLPF